MILPKKVRYSKTALSITEKYETFCETFLHHVGNDRFYGLPFVLEDWQRNLIWKPLFGTGRIVGGHFRRKYRRALIGFPRNYGKSELMAAVVLTVANMEPIHNGQYGIIASSKEQAKNTFSKLKSMIRLDPMLSTLWDILKDEIINKETGATIRVYPYGEAQLQSWHFNMCILDELHVYRDDTIWDAVTSGQGDIPGALAIGITTASDKREGFLWELFNKTDDDEMLKVWIGIDDNDDPNDERVWKKLCFPSWVTLESIRSKKKSMRARSFMRYILNAFPKEKTAEPAFDSAKVDRSLSDEAFNWHAPLVLGIDGAVSGDCFAQAYSYFEGEECHVYPIVFEAGENADAEGRYDTLSIAESIMSTDREYNLERITGDPAYIQSIALMLEREGIIVERFNQRDWAGMCHASQSLKNLIDDKRLYLHGPYAEIAAEHLKNCTVNTGNRDDGMWRIAKAGRGRVLKNDAAVAVAMSTVVAATVEESIMCATVTW